MRRYDIDSLDNRDAAAIERLAWLVETVLIPYHRAEVYGIERIPPGAGLYVGNHNSFAYTPDSYIFGVEAYRAYGLDAVPFGLGHELILQMPVVNQILGPLGAVRASHDNGARLFAAGKKVLVYPGSDFDAMRPFRDRDKIVFNGRQGYIRLALRHSVPIIPVVAAGAHSTFYIIDDLRWLARLIRADRLLRIKVWPLTLSLPWGLTLGPPPMIYWPLPSKILIEVLDPIRFERTGPDAAADPDWVAECAARVESRMQSALTRLAALRREKKRRSPVSEPG